MASEVQELILLKSNGKLTFEEQLEFKEKGRPKPILDLCQTTKDRGKQINRHFRETMYDMCDWICGCPVKNAFFCFPCLLACSAGADVDLNYIWTKVGVTDIKHLKEKVKKHSQSKIHMDSAMNYASLGRVDIRQQLDRAYRKSIIDFNEKVSQNRYILNKIIDCVKFCGSFELALRGHDESELSTNPGIFRGLIEFVSEIDVIFKDHLDKSTAFKGLSKTIQNDMLQSILAVTQEQIKREVGQTEFLAIQADEIIDSSNKIQMVFIIRYVINGDVHERFWKFIQPQGCSPQNLSDALLEELAILEVDKSPDKLIAQCYDGAAVMNGGIGGVPTKIKEHYPSAHFIHCYAHQLNLLLQKAVSQHKEIKIFFANLHCFSLFFGKSPKRTAVLDKLVKARLSNSAPTKWYFNTRCIETVYSYKTDIINCLEQIMDTEFDEATINQAGSLKGYLKDENFLYWLKYFHLIMPHVDTLFSQLQKADIGAVSNDKYISDFNTYVRACAKDNVVAVDNLNSNADTSSTTAKRRRTEDSKHRIALEICDIILGEIRHRFSFTDHLIVSRLFHSNKFLEYRNHFPEQILKCVQRNYHSINVSKLKVELEVIYNRDDFINSSGAIAILQLFLAMDLCETFSESVKLLNILCTLPMTTVESERCFSTLKKVKTFLLNTNTTEQSRLSALAMLSIEKTFIKSIVNFNELVIDHFAHQKDRRIDLVFKQA